MADKAVERVEPPYPDHWDSQVKGDDTAYVMVYTHVDDSIESVAFNKTGGEIKRMAGDFRRPATQRTSAAVGRVGDRPGKDYEGRPASAREIAEVGGRAETSRPSDRPGGPVFPGDYVSPDADDKPAKPTRPAAEVIPGVPAAGHEPLSARELPLPSKPLPEHDPKANRPKP